MAPSRGQASSHHNTANCATSPHAGTMEGIQLSRTRSSEPKYHIADGHHFTLRGIFVGLGVGLIICFSNTYFGLQTGWVSSMSMPSSLIGFAYFKTVAKYLDFPFSPVENVLVQSVAGSMGVMPLGCGFVGVMPAINYLLSKEENGTLQLSLGKLIWWSLGLCYFGVVFAVPLRRQVIIREKLKFPSGTATALMIGVLHGKEKRDSDDGVAVTNELNITPGQQAQDRDPQEEIDTTSSNPVEGDVEVVATADSSIGSWKARIRLLVISFSISGIYTLLTYFFPVLRDLPIFGTGLAENWLWALNPSFAYVGQGIIMGPATTIHMLLGAIVGWGFLSPLAKYKGWAPGPISDWETGSKGWIVWVSLAIMLVDSIVSLSYITAQPILRPLISAYRNSSGGWTSVFEIHRIKGYTPVSDGEDTSSRVEYDAAEESVISSDPIQAGDQKSLPELDAPPEQLIGPRTVWIGLLLSIIFCIGTIRISFGALIPLYATIAAVLVALLLSVMGVRALGETDLNPVSGISKIAQLFFALIIPSSNNNSVLINLVAGAVSEAGALQAGDLLQDLKTGHILGASPSAQFWGQMIGSTVGAVVSALIYKLYTSVYPIPGNLFQVPTAYVWVFTARLVTGKGLPPMAWQWAAGAAVMFTATTMARILGNGQKWHPLVPGGIAVAVGMYNVPSFTLARAVGGIINWFWISHLRRSETPIVVLASGLILGEGMVSIVNLLLASLNVPHL